MNRCFVGCATGQTMNQKDKTGSSFQSPPDTSPGSNPAAENQDNERTPYNLGEATHYEWHHQKNLRTWLTTWREQSILGHALRDAGYPGTVLDLPCGTGRFWPVFKSNRVEDLIAADVSPGMLEVAGRSKISPSLPSKLVETSAFDIALPDDAVELCASMRFFHHLSESSDRKRALTELARVSKKHIVISLWVDGNLGSYRRKKKRERKAHAGFGKRLCIPVKTIENEISACGLTIIRAYDVWPYLTMWRTYLLSSRTTS
jgi:SAM-dependent methyltransferase